PRILGEILLPKLLFVPIILMPATVFNNSVSVFPPLLSICWRSITLSALPDSSCFLGYLFVVSTTFSREREVNGDTSVVSWANSRLPIMTAAITKIPFFIFEKILHDSFRKQKEVEI